MSSEYDYVGDRFDGNETYEFDEDPMLSGDPMVRFVAMTVIVIYIMAFTIGIPANLYVLFRMRRLASNDEERYRNGTGVALCSMAAADLCSLLLIFAQNLHQMTVSSDGDSTLTDAMCKMMLFLTHTMTAVSIWSWLLLSSLRYLAICHPLYHLRLWQMPYRALAFVISMSVVLNAWLLVAVQSTQMGCTQVPLMRHSLTANRLFHLIESVWSFCIPCAVIIIVDTSVVLKSTRFPRWRVAKNRRKSALEEIIKLTRSTSMRLKARHQKALWKWLVIALICVLLNAPENMYRLVTLFSLPEFSEDAAQLATRMLAQALYFSQFAFNAIYLAVFVYDKSTRTKGELSSHHSCHAALQPIRSRLHSTSGADSPLVNAQKSSFVRLLHPESSGKTVLAHL